MHLQNLTIFSPLFEPHELSEAEVLGSSVWLWMHSDMHKAAPLGTLNSLLLPAIKTGQYMMAFDNHQPVAYIAWSKLDEVNEAAYLQHPANIASVAKWTSGDRYWMMDIIAPFGHLKQIRRVMANHLFPTGTMRALHHKGATTGIRAIEMHGVAVHPMEAKHWFASHPVCWPTTDSSFIASPHSSQPL